MDEKIQPLWAEFIKTRSLEARNALVVEYVHLVKIISRRLLPTYHKHVEFDDLMSSGMLGLMDAVDKFDPAKEVKFETYATLRIRGEIIDQIRRQDWAPISLRQKIKKVEDGYANLEGKLGRSASEREVAEFLGISEDDISKTLDDSHMFNVMCLDEVLVDRMKSDEYLVSQEDTPEEAVENREMIELLAKYIDTLNEKERQVIALYYYEELTLKEIGLTLGVSESRVSQIHSKAMMTLRAKLTAAIKG